MPLQDLLKKLITYKTLSHNYREVRRAFSWIKGQVRTLPIFIKEHTVNNFPALIITTQEGREPTLWLQAHIDVVPGSVEVFKPKVKGKYLYGRGSFDMKFAIACFIQLLKDMRRELERYDFGVMITSDEELGGQNGVKVMLEKGYHSKVCFLPDGGEEWQMERAAKGVWRIRADCAGVSSHASRPWEGKNSIEELMEFLRTLRDSFPVEPCEKEDHFHETMNIGTISGGNAVNSVPDFASSHLDLRFTPNSSKEELENIVQKAKKFFPNIAIAETTFLNSTSIDPQNQYVQTYLDIVKKKYGHDVSFMLSHGASDAQFFTQRGIPTIVIRPKGGGLHGETEWVDLKSLEQFYEVLKDFVKQIAPFEGKGLGRFRLIRILRTALRFLSRGVTLRRS